MDLLSRLVGGDSSGGSGRGIQVRIVLRRPSLVIPAPVVISPPSPKRSVFSAPSTATTEGDGEDGAGLVEDFVEDDPSILCCYGPEDDVSGHVILSLPAGGDVGRGLEHHGVRLELVGRIEMRNSSSKHHNFITLSRDLAPPSRLHGTKTYPFAFVRGISAAGYGPDETFSSYSGNQVTLRYFVRATLGRGGGMGSMLGPTMSTREISVRLVSSVPPSLAPGTTDEPIKMEVGIEDCLHIEFEYDRRRYHLNDVIVGRVNFLLVRIKIRRMELAVIRRESVADMANPNASNESQTLLKFEVMDGQPARGESVPVRLFLEGIPAELTPTYRDVYGRFSVKYFLNLVLIDEEDRRYFKQQEIELWRKKMS